MWFTGAVLYLVRHGRTEANALGLLQGRIDPPLDELGRIQAEAVAHRIGVVDLVISSPMVRAVETADYFTTADGSPLRIDDRWLEIGYGNLEGKPVSEVPRETWERWRNEPDFRTEGGESFVDLDRRVRSACDELASSMAEQSIVVVSHVSPIKAAVAWALGAGMEMMFRCHLGQASVCRIGMGAFGPVLHTFNEVPRLETWSGFQSAGRSAPPTELSP